MSAMAQWMDAAAQRRQDRGEARSIRRLGLDPADPVVLERLRDLSRRRRVMGVDELRDELRADPELRDALHVDPIVGCGR